jgi:hypothetical protein
VIAGDVAWQQWRVALCCFITMAGGVTLLCNDGRWCYIFIFIFFKKLLGSFKSLQLPPPLSLCMREREKENNKEKKRKRVLKLALGYVILCLVLLFPVPPILALLVGRGVTSQAPSRSCNTSSNNTSNKKKINNSKRKEICRFHH